MISWIYLSIRMEYAIFKKLSWTNEWNQTTLISKFNTESNQLKIKTNALQNFNTKLRFKSEFLHFLENIKSSRFNLVFGRENY